MRINGGGRSPSITLERAVNSCTSFYKPVRVSSPADDFNIIFGQLQSFDLLNNPRYRFEISALAGSLPMCIGISAASFERKKWYVFGGKCWQADVGSLKAMELCKSLADGLLQYALTIRTSISGQLSQRVRQMAAATFQGNLSKRSTERLSLALSIPLIRIAIS